MSRWCKDCGSEILGRSDKIYCGDACRSNYHNKRLSMEKRQIYQVNAILRKNRRILEQLYLFQPKKWSRKQLQRQGFNFDYFTHSRKMPDKIAYCCYDMAYCENGEGEIEILQDQESILLCK